MFHAPAEEPAIVVGLATALRPMTGHELGYFFVTETDLLAEATPEQRAFIREQYLATNSTLRLGEGVFSRTCPGVSQEERSRK
jgi:hypothetical protein